MMEWRRSTVAWALAALGLAVLGEGLGRGHESPEHVVEMLTARMETVGRQPDLLWRRATEYRALGQLDFAEKDLRNAIRRQKGFTQALVDLTRVQLAQGETNAALRTIRRAVGRNPAAAIDPGVLIVYAEVLNAAGRPAEAVAQCDRALAIDGVTNPEWYLVRCLLQYQLGRFQEAAAGLKQGVELTGNAVLEAEWIDAVIDAGDFAEGRRRVAEQLPQSRCQAAWLIRRGRVSTGEGRVSEAQADYLAAITELNGRLAGERKDFTLLAERGLAYALIGDVDQARTDLVRARSQGADHWVLHRLERALRD